MKKISDSELEVLKVIWDKKQASSLDIIVELEQFNWNNNTVRTLIKRLLEKEAIEIVDKKNKVFYYKSKINKEKYKYMRTVNLLNQLYDGDINNLLENYYKYDKNLKNQ